MHAAVKQRKSLASPLSTRQYAELRADLEAELRRLLPGETAGEGKLHDLLPSSRARALTIVGVLRRMDSEGFGVCVGCRSPIAYERLAAGGLYVHRHRDRGRRHSRDDGVRPVQPAPGAGTSELKIKTTRRALAEGRRQLSGGVSANTSGRVQ